jgi:hypothetical protein
VTPPVPPRIYCITATEAPTVAVFRRGPTNWSHVGQWDLAGLRYEPGAWLGGRIFPRRCDLSPDGRFLSYFAHKPSATWELGEAYVAVSKLPWLTALHAFPTCGTWTRGYCFTKDPGTCAHEAPDSPPRDPRDVWDEGRNARIQKRQPGGHRVLCVESTGHAGGEFGTEQAIDGLRVQYSLEADGQLTLLNDLQWADWDREGRLLVATRTGRLQIRHFASKREHTVFDEDLALFDPKPVPAPDWARRW